MIEETFKTVIADPPWRYQQWTDAKHGAAESAYGTMADNDLLDLGTWVQDVTANDCVLLLWATWPKLREALELAEVWGFEYVTAVPWVKSEPGDSVLKVQRGIGFWTMGTSEVVLCCRRGNAGPGRTRKLGLMTGEDRQFWHPRRAHSRKPDGIHEYAEEFLEGPRLELFARREREGWTCLGNELGWNLTPRGPEKIEKMPKLKWGE